MKWLSKISININNPNSEIATLNKQEQDTPDSFISLYDKYRLSHGWFEIWFLSTSD